MNDTTLTPTQQRRVASAREFLTIPTSGEPAGDLGEAKQHLRFLLKVIAELTGDLTVIAELTGDDAS